MITIQEIDYEELMKQLRSANNSLEYLIDYIRKNVNEHPLVSLSETYECIKIICILDKKLGLKLTSEFLRKETLNKVYNRARFTKSIDITSFLETCKHTYHTDHILKQHNA